MGDYNLINILVMVLVGALSGTLAARIMRGDHFGFFTNAILGIAGAVVGFSIFNFFNINPGAFVVNSLDSIFGVKLPSKILGLIISSTLGAILILWIGRTFKKVFGKTRRHWPK